MRSPFVLLVLGLVVVGGAVGGDLSSKRMQLRRAADIRQLGVELDSTRGALAGATNAADSARLAASVADRTRLLASRELHAGGVSQTVPARWSLTGPSVVFATAGVALMALAIFLIVRDARVREP